MLTNNYVDEDDDDDRKQKNVVEVPWNAIGCTIPVWLLGDLKLNSPKVDNSNK